MRQWGKPVSTRQLTLRTSPRDGDEITALRADQDQTFEILGKETWMRVRLESGEVGFVLADYVELQDPPEDADTSGDVRIAEYHPQRSDVFTGPTIYCDAAFNPALVNLEKIASDHQLKIKVISSFREPYEPVSGAVVDPARYSNHHIGHALDFNLILAGQPFRSTDLHKLVPEDRTAALPADSGLPDAVRRFIVEAESTGLRWGGRFSTPDPTHIDDGLNMKDRQGYENRFVALWGEAALGADWPVRRAQVG